ncbi:MAG: capsule biosynthesis protein, partial [Methyloglobulus sp.]
MNTTLTNTLENGGKPSDKGFLAYIRRMNRLFLCTVIVPTLLSILYFGFIASDVYISESRFIVRSPDRQSASPLGIIFKETGFSSEQDDSYTVQDFMLSRDALKSLDYKLGVRKIFASNSIDIFSRFAGLDWDDSFEALHIYYQDKVSIEIET